MPTETQNVKPLNFSSIGNALGGVRSPHVDAPLALLDSENSGISFCRLFGRAVPFNSAKILDLYPTKADFMAKWLDSINDSVANGFLLPEDGSDLAQAAEAWQFPN
jgi:hypothetical protein